jgi:transcriptional regulator with XRE-family HTH domain
MSPGSTTQDPTPAAAALATRLATETGAALADERRRRAWTVREVARRARLSAATVTNVEAGRPASHLTYARLATALGLSIRVDLTGQRRRAREPHDLVHAAMGDLEAGWLHQYGFEVAVDHPYQHYQFAGRADVLAWTLDPPCLLHLENRTRFPDLQDAAGSFNAKRQFLGAAVARQLGLRAFVSETHVMVGLWSAEVIHVVRLRHATFRSLCPDPGQRLSMWRAGQPPISGRSSSFALLDVVATGRQRSLASMDQLLDGIRPRVRDYRAAAERLRALGRA